MIRKTLFLILAAVFLAGLSGFSLAGNYPFEGGVIELGSDPGFAVYQRYYLPSQDKVSPACPNSCANCDTATAGGPYCTMTFKAKKSNGSFRGYSDNIINFNNAPYGSMAYMILDAEANGGASNHVGYYAWTAKAVNDGDTGKWFDPNCAGTVVYACLGPASPSNASDVLQVPDHDGNGTAGLQAIGGLRPIPVPRVDAFDGTNFNLSWDAATPVGDTAEARYDLHFAITAPSGGNCPEPTTADMTFLRTEAGNSTTVTMGDVGLAPGDEQCVTFSMQLRFPAMSDGTELLTRYFSANGQSVYTGQGGLAVKIYDLTATWVGRNNVEVDWKTSLEDGVVGFYVTRSFTANGTYQRVSDLIRANGEPSAYSFIDSVSARSGAVSGVFYRIEAIDVDDELTVSGTTQLELPALPDVERKIRQFRRPVRGR
ncbi:MAG: hypothetical protein Q9Q40_04635 [Acidobacteriota bacterium]|nr:hypothetical protein [Acidobacteriota bacterium]